MEILIPSKGRADRLLTTKYMSSDVLKQTSLVVYANEYEDYKHHDVNIIVRPTSVKGIAQTREWLAHEFKGKRVWMWDDDLEARKHYCIEGRDLTKHQKCMDPWEEMIDMANTAMDMGFSWGGVFNRTAPVSAKAYPAILLQRQYTNTWFDFSVIDPSKYQWADIEFAEDLNISLQLAQTQIPSLQIMKYTVSSVTQSAGGCSTVRTVEKHNESMRQLQAKFPKSVKLKTQPKLMDGKEKLGTTIQFKKIYENPKQWDHEFEYFKRLYR